jgi:ribosome-binding protein aMBF1 (putative translation factor)
MPTTKFCSRCGSETLILYAIKVAKLTYQVCQMCYMEVRQQNIDAWLMDVKTKVSKLEN